MFQKKQPKKNQKKSTEDNFLIVPSLSKIEDNINNKSAAKNHLHIFFQKEFFSLLKRRWKIVTGITCGITAIVAWWIFQQSPIYQGKFVLLLEKQQGLQNTDNNNNQIIVP